MGKICNAISDALRAIGGAGDRIRPTSAVILAAGNSERMGSGVSKQLLTLDGMPVIAHTIAAFDECEYISEIIVVAKKDDFPVYREIQEKFRFGKFVRLVSGGDTRQKSAENGFRAVSGDSKFVALHDGARCLVTPDMIRDVCRVAYKTGAATAATRAVDSVKLTNGKNIFIDQSLDRSRVFFAQTPQVFRCELYSLALDKAKEDKLTVTDDNSLVENLGARIRLVECGRDNLKITTQEDLPLALAVLRSRKERAVK